LVDKLNKPTKTILLQKLVWFLSKINQFLKLNRTDFIQNHENQTRFCLILKSLVLSEAYSEEEGHARRVRWIPGRPKRRGSDTRPAVDLQQRPVGH
jgi:hypothetical protein